MSLNETISNLGDSIVNLVDKKRRGTLGLEQGDVGYDKEVLEDIRKYKHSTFDKSKFTVVGSPTISDDGIASGFSNSSYLSINPNVISNIGTKNYTYTITFTLGADTTTEQTIYSEGRDSSWKERGFAVGLFRDGRLVFSIGGENGDMIARDWAVTFQPFEAYSTHTVQLEYINGVYNFYLDGRQVTSKPHTVVKSSQNLKPTIGAYNYNNTSSYYYGFKGSVDLKQFSITVDGEEVFSGNKTGIDVIKEDNYTVVGSPVISEDGIVTPQAKTDRIEKNIRLNSGQNIVAECNFIFKGSNCPIIDFLNYSNSTRYAYLTVGGKGAKIAAALNEDTLYRIADIPQMVIGKSYKLRFETDLKYYIRAYVNDVKYIDATIQTAQNTNVTVITMGTYENWASSYYNLGNVVDLNSYKIYADGKLIYQPCLKIPYTLSKTGSKIVNEVYRDRVIDMYEQEGQAGYYTIQEGKKGNYTVVGSPTIVNGVASGFSKLNYITIPNYLKGKRNYEIDIEFTLPETLETFGYVFSEANAMTGLGIYYDRACVYVRATTANVNGFTESIANGNYKLKIKYNDGVGTVQYRVNNAEEETYQLNLSNYVDFQEDLLALSCRIKNGTGDGSLFNGSIDLNALKIYIDGELVYQAITPPNYTLPMGDVYGVLSAKSNSSEIAHYAMPSEVLTDLTIGASGSTYTAPADGYFFLDKSITDQSQFTTVTNTNTNLVNQCTGVNLKCISTTPARKGDIISVTYTAAGATNAFKFIYAEGSKGEKQ